MADLEAKFPDLGLKFSIGKSYTLTGTQISTHQYLSAAFALTLPSILTSPFSLVYRWPDQF